MIQNKEQLRRIFEIEDRLSEGDLTLEQMLPYEQEQKSIIIDQYCVYKDFILKKFSEYQEKYGDICNFDFFQYAMCVYNDNIDFHNTNLYIYAAAEYDDGRWSKPRFEFSNIYGPDIRLTFEEIFDLEVAEHNLNKYLIEKSYEHKEELIRKYNEIKQLENLVDNSNKLSIDLQCNNEFWDIDYNFSDKPVSYYEEIK